MSRPADDDDYGDSDGRWLNVDWGPHVRSAEVDGAVVNYLDYGSGQGPPVLLLHGLGGAWQNWLEQIPHLGDSHRVLAPDLPGFGESPMPPFELGIDTYGRHLDRFCEVTGFDRGIVIGNSMGGFIAAEMAHAFPDRVEKVVLVSPAGYSHADPPSARMLRLARAASLLDPLFIRLGRKGFRRPRLRRGTFGRVFHHPERLHPAVMWEMMVKGWGRPGFMSAVRGLFGYDLHDRLAEVKAPVLIVWGEEDRINPAADAEGFMRLLPHARLVLMPETGHSPMIERPSRFNRVVGDFINP